MKNTHEIFDTLIELLEELGKSTRGYRKCAEVALEAAAKNPDLAAPLYILATAAERLVDINDRMPVPSKAIQAAYETYIGDVATLRDAFAGDDDKQKVDLLNRVAARIIAGW